MTIVEMEDEKKYKCVYRGTAYSGWSKRGIIRQFPWMTDMDIWEEDV